MEPVDEQAKITALLSEAKRETKAYHARLRRFQAQRWVGEPFVALLAVPFVLLVVLALFLFLLFLFPPLALVVVFGLLFSSIYTAAKIGAHINNRHNRKQKLKIITSHHNALLWELASIGSRQAIGLFIDTLDLQDWEAREMAENALAKLLPRLPPQEADRITNRQRQKLYQSLMTFEEGKEALCLAIVQVIAVIGDHDAIPVLENVAIRKASSPVRQRVIQAAQEMLPILKERLRREKTGETLLRASGPPAALSETLLRPSAYLPAVEPQQLLRASTQETENP